MSPLCLTSFLLVSFHLIVPLVRDSAFARSDENFLAKRIYSLQEKRPGTIEGWEKGLELCHEFMQRYKASPQLEKVHYAQLEFLQRLGRTEEFMMEAASFRVQYSESRYVVDVTLRQADLHEAKQEYEAMLALLQSIPDTLKSYRVYHDMEKCYALLRKDMEAAQARLSAESLIIGKRFQFSEIELSSGRTLPPEAFLNKIVVMSFWAPWDKLSAPQLGRLSELYEYYKHRTDVVFLNISFDTKPEQLQAYLENHAIPGFHTIQSLEFLQKFGIVGMPYYLIMDKHGVVIDKSMSGITGSIHDWVHIDGLIRSLIHRSTLPGPPKFARLLQIEAEIRRFQGQDDEAIHYDKAACELLPEDLRLLIRTGNIVHARRSADSASFCFGRAFSSFKNRIDLIEKLDPDLAKYFAFSLWRFFRKDAERFQDQLAFLQPLVAAEPTATSARKEHLREFLHRLPEMRGAFVPVLVSDKLLTGIKLKGHNLVLLPAIVHRLASIEIILQGKRHPVECIFANDTLGYSLLRVKQNIISHEGLVMQSVPPRLGSFAIYAKIVPQDSAMGLNIRSLQVVAPPKADPRLRTLSWMEIKNETKPGAMLLNSSGQIIGLLTLKSYKQKEAITFLSISRIESQIKERSNVMTVK